MAKVVHVIVTKECNTCPYIRKEKFGYDPEWGLHLCGYDLPWQELEEPFGQHYLIPTWCPLPDEDKNG